MTLHIAWERDTSRIDSLMQLFMANRHASYISHSEVLSQRADTFDTWSIDLTNVLHNELTQACKCNRDNQSSISVIEEEGNMLGFALIERIQRTTGDIAILSDLVVDSTIRRRGIGTQLLMWVEQELSKSGVRMLLLESGIHNERAHHFFQQQGYHTTSVMMAKTLQTSTTRGSGY